MMAAARCSTVVFGMGIERRPFSYENPVDL